MNKTNPYPKYITDEVSGIEVMNEKWMAWEEGYSSCLAELIKGGLRIDGPAAGWVLFLPETARDERQEIRCVPPRIIDPLS